MVGTYRIQMTLDQIFDTHIFFGRAGPDHCYQGNYRREESHIISNRIFEPGEGRQYSPRAPCGDAPFPHMHRRSQPPDSLELPHSQGIISAAAEIDDFGKRFPAESNTTSEASPTIPRKYAPVPMNRSASFTTLFLLTLITMLFTTGVSQDSRRPPSPEAAPERPPIPFKKTPEIRPPIPERSTEETEFTISKQIDEVNLILSVTDSKGRFVDNLSSDDLKLLDNHKPPEKWNYFQARTNLPLHVILAIDVSSSIRARLHFEQRAASTFLKHVLRKESDKAAIIAFGTTVQEKTAGMSSDVNALDATIRTL